MILFRVGILIVALVISVSGQGAETGWRIGLAKVKITPERPVRMAGYDARPGPSQSVSSDLYAKALALEDQQGHRALLITADIIGFNRELSEAVCTRLKASTGLERDAILLTGAHNHCGPIIALQRSDWDDSGQHPLTGQEWQRVIEYGKQLRDKLAALGEQALSNLQSGRLSWGTGVVNFVMNRREFTEGGIILGVNPRGPVDRSVPVLRVENLNGELRGVVFGAASHNTTLDDDYMSIDGEFAGYAQTYVESKYPGVQAMFMIGSGGDANPYPRGTVALARRHGEELGREVARVLGTNGKRIRGPIRTECRFVDLPLQKLTRAGIERLAKEPSGEHGFFARGALKMLDSGKKLPEFYRAPFALWQFGGDLTLVGYSGETLVSYVALAERTLGPLNLWVAGYCNDVYGYLTSPQVQAEGGYETRGLYADIGLFVPRVEDVIAEALAGMARAAGRSLPANKQ